MLIHNDSRLLKKDHKVAVGRFHGDYRMSLNRGLTYTLIIIIIIIIHLI